MDRQALKNVKQASWLFGHPVLRSDNNSVAYWSRPTQSPLNQKGGGWMPCLHGRVQTGDDWAALYVPVNEMPLPVFQEAQWAYYMTGTETMGVNIVIWVHDPADFDKRAEITQLGGASGLEKAAGWNAHEFDKTTTQMFFYGEGTTGTTLTAGTQYTLEEFQADPVFKHWTIYRISLEYGWEASGTFDPVWIAEVKLNQIPIPLKPNEVDIEAPIFQYETAAGTAIATALAPKTPFQLLRVDLHLNSAATQDTFTISVDAGKTASVYDTKLLSQAMSGYQDLVQTFGEGFEFMETDEIDCAWANNDQKTYGITYVWRSM
jgi:hypothetical protein